MKKNVSRKPSNSNLKDNNEIEVLNKIINNIKNENLDLKKENEMLKVENLEKNLIISKLKSEKFLLFNELNELTNSLKIVDMKLLNKFYKNLSSNLKINKSFMPFSLGIKYNIASVQNQLSYLMHSDLISTKGFNEYTNKAKETLIKEKCKVGFNNFYDELDVNIENENFIDLDKYLTVVKSFEREFEKIYEKNLQKSEWISDQ